MEDCVGVGNSPVWVEDADVELIAWASRERVIPSALALRVCCGVDGVREEGCMVKDA